MTVQPYIIGITGGSASGKSTFARQLKNMFTDDEMTIVNEDNYYLPKDRVPVDGNGVQNFDVPESIDHAAYIGHVSSLRAGRLIQKKEYIFARHDIEPRMLTLHPTPIIVLEGIFTFHYDEMKDLMDLKIYIDAEPGIRLNRRLNRDLAERGLDRDDVEYRWNNHIAPRYEQDHAIYKACADIIIQNNTSFLQGLNVLTAYLKGLITAPVKSISL